MKDYEQWEQAMSEWRYEIAEKDKEIERLNNTIDNLIKERDCLFNNTKIEYENKIQKLNNIIDELEKDLLDSIDYWENQERLWEEEGFIKFGGEANNKIIFKGVLKTLQELKEGK